MTTGEFEEILKNGQFIGLVEENEDPDKKQRVRVRVPFLHGEKKDIPTNDLPWAEPKRDLNGITFQVPDKDKVVYITYPDGNLYYPIYEAAVHLNINLQKKIEQFSGEDYTSFIAFCYNHNTQIWAENKKGLNIIHKFNGINILSDEMTLLLKDNQSTLYLGDNTGNQELMLGTNFMQWFDTLMQVLNNPYIGNSGAPVVANPQLLQVLAQYQAKRSTFLSRHIFAVDNNQVKKKDFDVDGQIGDKIERDTKDKDLKVQSKPIDYKPKPPTEEHGIAEQNDYKYSEASDEPAVNPNPVEGENNAFLMKLIDYLKSQNYTVYEDAYVLNIVGSRNSLKDDGIVTNRFDDFCYVFYKDDKSKWNFYKYTITTTPGYVPRQKVLPTNVAMVVYAQYKDQYKIGYHQNRTGKQGGAVSKKTGQLYPEHRCLVQARTAQVRHPNGSTKYKKPSEQTQVEQQAIGINIHRTLESGGASSVDNWSEGCMVFQLRNQHNEFMSLCDQQVEKAKKGKFTFTLIPQKELDNHQA